MAHSIVYDDDIQYGKPYKTTDQVFFPVTFSNLMSKSGGDLGFFMIFIRWTFYVRYFTYIVLKKIIIQPNQLTVNLTTVGTYITSSVSFGRLGIQ